MISSKKTYHEKWYSKIMLTRIYIAVHQYNKSKMYAKIQIYKYGSS